MLGRVRIQYKTLDQMRLMRRAGLVVADALDAVRAAVRPGVTTKELDAIAEDVIRTAGATPSFLHYGVPPYPASTCISVNDEIVHGIPGPRVVAAGDVVSVDCGAVLSGWHGDSAVSVIAAGPAGPEAGPAGPEAGPGEPGAGPGEPGAKADRELVAVTEQAMWAGIGAIVAGARLGTIGGAIEDLVAGRYGLVEEYGGHGIGTEMHQDPHVLNYRTRDLGRRMRPGLCLAVEPMLTIGGARTRVAADEWTVSTIDGSRAAHVEHSVALHDGGLWVLTARDGGEEGLATVGARFAPLGD